MAEGEVEGYYQYCIIEGSQWTEPWTGNVM